MRNREDENKAIVRRLLEEMDKGNLDIFDELFSTDYVCHFPGRPEPLDGQGHKEAARAVYEAP